MQFKLELRDNSDPRLTETPMTLTVVHWKLDNLRRFPAERVFGTFALFAAVNLKICYGSFFRASYVRVAVAFKASDCVGWGNGEWMISKCRLVMTRNVRKSVQGYLKTSSSWLSWSEHFRIFFCYAILQTVAQTIENLFWERSPPSCTAISTTAEAIRMYLSEAMSPFLR